MTTQSDKIAAQTAALLEAYDLLECAYPEGDEHGVMDRMHEALELSEGVKTEGATVRECIDPSALAWFEAFTAESGDDDDAMLACEADSVVGRKIITLVAQAMLLVDMMDEPDDRSELFGPIVHQCEVWYYG